MKNIYTAILGALLVLPAWGQEPASTPAAKSKLPEGPLLRRAPESARWIVTHKVDGGRKDEGGNLQPGVPNARDFRAVISKAKTTYHVEMDTGKKARIDKWCLDNFQITKMPNAQFPVISTAANQDPYFLDFSKSDFPDVEWVSLKNFVETRDVGGVACLVFRDRVRISDQATEEGEAIIAAATRFPVALRVGEALTTFQQQPAPDSLVPPPDVLALAKQWTERQRRAALRPPP